MNYKQLIIVNESNRQTKSDYMYIRSFIDHFFKVDQYIRLYPVYLNGKGNYDNRSIRKEIETETKLFKQGITYVVYCLDTDNLESDPNASSFCKKLEEFCNRNGYYLVFFNRDIEEVFLGKRIDSSDKKKAAESFLRKRNIEYIDLEKFKSKVKRRYFSNLYLVLDQLLEKKEAVSNA